jgi:hypothetical protein
VDKHDTGRAHAAVYLLRYYFFKGIDVKISFVYLCILSLMFRVVSSFVRVHCML